MLRFLNSPATVIALRVAACGLATFVGAFLMANHRYPCSRREIFRYQLRTEDTLLTAMALTVAMMTLIWVCLHAWGKVKWIASLNYLFEIVSFVLILVPMIYWGTSATAATACGTLKDQTGSVCLSNVCDVIQVSMTTSSVLLLVLLISFFIAFFQTRKASTPTMLNKCVVNEAMMEVCTPRDTFHTELVTPTTCIIETASSYNYKQTKQYEAKPVELRQQRRQQLRERVASFNKLLTADYFIDQQQFFEHKQQQRQLLRRVVVVIDEEEQTPDIIAQITSKFRDAIGTRDSRFANRTNPTLKWKEGVAYAMAESNYLTQQKAQQDAILVAHRAKKIEAKRAKKARKQDKLNRKIARKMERKAKACDERAAKIERKMQILAELRLERLANVREQGVQPMALWVSAAEAQHRATLAEFTEAETAKEKAMTDSRAVADDMGRRIGMLPALRSSSRPSLPEEIETTLTLTLRLADPLSAKPKTLFTISLKRFRHVETMFGDKIGERGCVELGKSLLTGACPRLKVLNLGWNAIKYRGLVSLAKALERGGGSQLVVLDLRSNQLNAEAVGSLFDAMAAGGVPELTTLILSGNVLGDAGGKAIAHAFLQGLFGTLHTLDVKSNSIRNDGCRAMFTAFTADCFACLAPKLELLDMRRNCINQVTAETFVPCPKHIAF